ncbi:MAG: YceI family protein [Hyphomicrobiaceae bacterium]
MTIGFSPAQKTFHWLTLLLVGVLFALGWTMVPLPPSPSKLQYYSWHKWTGVTVFTLTAIRLLWRIGRGVPQHEELPRWMRRSATLNHVGLYTLLFALPILGWLMSSASGFPVVVFGLVRLPDLVAPDPPLADALKTAHKLSGWALLALLGLHVGAAFFHHIVRRDTVLVSMLPGGRSAAAILALVLVPLLPAAALRAGPTDPWVIDRAQSVLEFEVIQMSVPLKGRFERWSGDIRFDPSDPGAARARVEIDIASVRTGNRDVDGQVPADAFFAAKTFPQAVFEATGFRAEGGNRYTLAGRLTLRGIAMAVSLPVTIAIAKDTARPGLLRAEAQGETTLRRLDFKVGMGEWEKTDVIANDVRVRIRIVATRSE